MVNSRATGCERHRQYSSIRKRHGGALEVSPQGQCNSSKGQKAALDISALFSTINSVSQTIRVNPVHQ